MADLPDSPPAAAPPSAAPTADLSAPAAADWAWDARRAAQLGILTFARFCLNTMLRVVYPFAPAFARGLGVPVTTIYLLISLRNFTGLLSPVFAPLPERYGRRNVMAFSLAVFSAAALLVAGVPAVWSLGAALVIVGAVKVIYDPAMQSYLGDAVPYHQRGRALALTEFGWSGAFLVGAPLTGWLIARQGWSAPFLWLGVGGAMGAVLLWRALPAARRHAHGTITIGYTWQMLRRHPIIWAAALYMLLPLIAQEALFIVYGDWMESTFNLSLTGLGLATTLIGLAEMSGEATAGWSVDRFGKRPVVALSGVLTAVVFLLIPLSAGSLTTALAALVALFFMFEIAVVGAIPLLTELVPEARGVVMSMSFGAMAAGRTIGSIVGPAVWARAGMWGNSLIAATVMLLAVVVLVRWLREAKQGAL
ncbi:MAG: MFS transporter [Candidatus Promineofilum sp.]|nr:MFS transporter [Promineifilum sp.]MCW5862394.1 MFS transporter [Anaerolineae bacterium]